MSAWTMLGVAVIAAMLAVTLRQTQPTFALVLTVLVGAGLFAGAVTASWPLIEQVRSLIGRLGEALPFAQVLIKALGISLLTQLAADICRDAGESALASRVELGGKVMVLVCGMPLFDYAVRMLEQVVRGEAVGW